VPTGFPSAAMSSGKGGEAKFEDDLGMKIVSRMGE
jgi:hypothetical protein